MKREQIKKLVVMAMLAALSMVLVAAIHVPLIPVVSFLEYDPADIPILIATMAYGPVAGLVLTVIVSVIQGLFISTTGPWGILMHIIATGMLVLVAGGIYRVRHTRGGAILGLVNGLRIYIMYSVIYAGQYENVLGYAIVVSVSLFFSVVLAKLVGGMLPLAAKKVGLDPAIMATPFITTIVDACSLILYFKIAMLVFAESM